tara:strand:+ start:477 stop:752 length:276 start_codon:yes stop_codon:yes gene_type:complete
MFNKFKKWFHFWIIAKPVPKAEVVDEKPKAEPKPKAKAKAKAESKPVRTRTIKGRYVADDLSTPDVNEAWVGGKAPTKKSKPKVVRKKAKS